MTATRRRTKIWLAVGGLVFALLLAAIFTLGSLRLPTFIQAQMGPEVLILWAVTAFLVVNLIVFGLVLTRSLLKLGAERRARQVGSRFKTRMVVAAVSLSLLPLVFLFIVSYALLNRTLSTWFPRPLEMAAQAMISTQEEIRANEILRIGRSARARLRTSRNPARARIRQRDRASPRRFYLA